MKLLLKIVVIVVAVYLVVVGVVTAAMFQPPERFTRVMARLPGPVMMALPFRPLWITARAGHLQAGDAAPDFDLETVDHKARVQLSSFRGDRPVVLVFGSYT